MKTKSAIEIVLGLLVFIFVAYLLTFSSWFLATIRLLQGGIVIVLFLIGVGILLLGIADLKP